MLQGEALPPPHLEPVVLVLEVLDGELQGFDLLEQKRRVLHLHRPRAASRCLAGTHTCGRHKAAPSAPTTPGHGELQRAPGMQRGLGTGTRPQHRVSSRTVWVWWRTPGCPASHREHAALHTPCSDGKGQNPAGPGSITHPRSSAAPAPGTRCPLPKTRGSPRLLQGPSLHCWGHSSSVLPAPPGLSAQQLPAPLPHSPRGTRTSWLLPPSAPARPCPGHLPAAPACTAGAGSTRMLGRSTVPLCCSSAVRGEEAEERGEEAELSQGAALEGAVPRGLRAIRVGHAWAHDCCPWLWA